jgi:hypothetical protein
LEQQVSQFLLAHLLVSSFLQVILHSHNHTGEVANMVSTGINYWAVLVAGMAYFILGAIWYAGPVFGNSWMKAIGKTKEQVEADFSAMKLVWAFFGSLVIAYGLARVLDWSNGATFADGIVAGALAAVCFVGASAFINDKMEGRSGMLFGINFLYTLLGFMIMGAIIGAW